FALEQAVYPPHPQVTRSERDDPGLSAEVRIERRLGGKAAHIRGHEQGGDRGQGKAAEHRRRDQRAPADGYEAETASRELTRQAPRTDREHLAPGGAASSRKTPRLQPKPAARPSDGRQHDEMRLEPQRREGNRRNRGPRGD